MSTHSFLGNTSESEPYRQRKSIDSVSAARPPITKRVLKSPQPVLRFPALKRIFAVFVLFLFLYPVSGLYGKQAEPKSPETTMQPLVVKESVGRGEALQKSQGLPVRLKIPAINVDAVIENVGLTSEGVMAVPDNTVNVGWFDLGSRPGENGSAVIAGHFNGKNGEVGVFTRLHKLKEGDMLHVENSDGTSVAFVVQGSRNYEPGYASDVFRQSDDAHLNLITCSGEWDGAKGSYSKRLVVFATIADKSLSLK